MATETQIALGPCYFGSIDVRMLGICLPAERAMRSLCCYLCEAVDFMNQKAMELLETVFTAMVLDRQFCRGAPRWCLRIHRDIYYYKCSNGVAERFTQND